MENNEKTNTPTFRFPGFTDEWKVKKLGEITDNIYQPQTISKEQFTNVGYPVYGANGLIGLYDKYNHQTPQILITCRGSSCGTINYTNGKCWITGNAMVVNLDKVEKKYDKRFFFYLLSNCDLSSLITGSGQPQIVRTPLLNMQIIVPPTIQEQQKIASCLSSIDDEITAEQSRLDALRSHKQGLMQQLFPQEGQTTPSRRFPGFTDEWREMKLGKVAKISSGKSIQADEIKDTNKKGYYPCYGGNGLRGYVQSYLYDGTYPIIGRVGAQCGNIHLANGKFYATEHALVVTLSKFVSPKFMEYLLTMMNLNQYGKGAAQPVLSASSLMDLESLLPSLPEQQKIADCLSSIDSQIAAQQSRIDALKQHKQGLMQKLFPPAS